MLFDGRAIIITRGAGGIGRAAAQAFAKEGGHVIIADLNGDSANEAAKAISDNGGPEALAAQCDVSDEASVERAVDATIAKFGRLDVVVNNAGLMVFKPITELNADDWIKVLHVDLLGAFFFTKQAFLKMKNGGAIVNVSSIHAVETEPLVAPYAAAKAALVSLTRSASLEGKPKGIRVNCILPGAV